MSNLEMCPHCHQPIFSDEAKTQKVQHPIKTTYHDKYTHLTFGDYIFIFKNQMQVARKKETPTGYSVTYERYPVSQREQAIKKCDELNSVEVIA